MSTSSAVCYYRFSWTSPADVGVEGVLVAKKDFNLPKHNEIDTKNLYVSLS